MSKSIIISERDNIAAVVENNKVTEFFINRGDMLLGDVYLAYVENILPSIDAAFVNLGGDRMGFLHASDVPGKGPLKDRLTPKQQLLVQIVKEPTGHKGPRVTTSLSMPGRFLVLMPDEKGISVSRKIVSPKERARLKSVVNLIKPTGVGVIIRTEAESQTEAEIQEDLELLLEKWNNIVSAADTVTPPNLLYRDQDLLYKVVREACTEEISEIILDTPFAVHRANQLLQSWNIGNGIKVSAHKGNDPLLVAKGIDKEIRAALQTKVNMPSGGYLYIQTTEALTVVDVNSGKFTSSATQSETIRKTNLEAVAEISRQLKLRNIGGMIIIDFIDMENRVDQLAILEELEMALEPDKSKPQVGQLSDLGLVELTRHRQGQALAEIFSKKCPACSGTGAIIEEFNFAIPPVENDFRSNHNKNQKLRAAQGINPNRKLNNNNNNNNNNNKLHQKQQQNAEIKQIVSNELKPQPIAKKIKTFPTINQQAVQKVNKQEPVENQPQVELTDESIKQLFSSKYLPGISKIIKFSPVPSKVARKLLPDSYIVDMFTILQELENFESEPQQPKQVAPAFAQQRFNTKENQHHSVPQPQPERQPQQVMQAVEAVPVTVQEEVVVKEVVVDTNVEEVKVEQQHLPEVVETQKLDKTEAVSVESEVSEPLAEQEAPVKKVVRRGRKPKSATSKSTTRRRTTTPKITKPITPEE